MPKCIVFNNVNTDGLGDFIHFMGIINKLIKNPRFSNVQFIPVVYRAYISDSDRSMFQEKLKSLDLPFYLGDNRSIRGFESQLKQDLKTADQVLVISFDGNSFNNQNEDCLMYRYGHYLKPNIPIKYIGEHEVEIYDPEKDPTEPKPTNRYNRSMGLSKQLKSGNTTYGIKITDAPAESTANWDLIGENDPTFIAKLMASTKSTDVKEPCPNHVMVPVYFNRNWDFIEFLRIFSANNSYNKGKDIIIIHSGPKFDDWADQRVVSGGIHLPSVFDQISEFLKIGQIKQLLIYTPEGSNPTIIEGNPKATTMLSILTGFKLSDYSFNEVFKQAEFAAISGDNTFERCVSMNVLPFYCSTNWDLKKGTLAALQEITLLPELQISDEARRSYQIFFDPESISILYPHQNPYYPTHTRILKIERYAAINFQEMIDAWPVVTAYLKEHHNFYDNLESIVLENFPLEQRIMISQCDQTLFTSTNPGSEKTVNEKPAATLHNK